MIDTDCYEQLERVIGEHGTVSIERDWKPRALPWSCDIWVEPGGFGTGNTMQEAIEDALRDFESAS